MSRSRNRDSSLRRMRLARVLTFEDVQAAILALYGVDVPTRRIQHFEKQPDSARERIRLQGLTPGQIENAIRHAGGEVRPVREKVPPAPPAPKLRADVEGIVLDEESRALFLEAWADPDLTPSDVQTLFGLGDRAWRDTLRFLGLNVETRVTTAPAAPAPEQREVEPAPVESAPPPTPRPTPPTPRPTPPAPKRAARSNIGSNTAYHRASDQRRRYLGDLMERMGLTRSALVRLYDSRQVSEIAEHYGVTATDVYVMLGMHDVALRVGRVAPDAIPAPWPEVARPTAPQSTVVREIGVDASPDPQPQAERLAGIASGTIRPASATLRATLGSLRSQRDDLAASVEADVAERDRLSAQLSEVRERLDASRLELEQLDDAIEALARLVTSGAA